MKPVFPRRTLAHSLLVTIVVMALAAPAWAARIGVVSNRYASETAANLATNIPDHTFTAVETAVAIPSLGSLTGSFDVLLLFEDLTYANATGVGNAVAAFANTGRPVVIGAFYEQDRTDGPAVNLPHGWGALEQLDPNTSDGQGTPYAPRNLDTTTLIRHPLTTGLKSLFSAKFAGGNQPKAGTTVVAWWQEPNARGERDPAIAVRVTGAACITHVALAPNYPSIGTLGTDFAGDFHRVWKNAFDFAAGGCKAWVNEAAGPDAVETIPTLSQWGLALTILLVGFIGLLQRRGDPRRASRRQHPPSP